MENAEARLLSCRWEGLWQTLIVCILAVISWGPTCVFLVVSVYLRLRTVIIIVRACVWSK